MLPSGRLRPAPENMHLLHLRQHKKELLQAACLLTCVNLRSPL